MTQPAADATASSVTTHSSRSTHWLSWSCATSIAAVLIASTITSLTSHAGHLDDAIPLDAAMLTLRGQVPNQDFYSVYPPLPAYVLAGMFKLFGESVVTYRIMQSLAQLITLAALARLALHRAGARTLFVLAIAVLLNARLYELHPALALMWSTLALMCLFEGRRVVPERSAFWLASAGVFLAAALWSRPNFGLYLCLLWALDAGGELLRSRRESLRPLWRELAWIGSFALIACVAIWQLWGGSLSQLVYQNAIMTSRALAYTVITPVPAKLSVSSIFVMSTSGIAVPMLSPGWLAIRCWQQKDRENTLLFALLAAAFGCAALLLGRLVPLALPLLVFASLPVLLAARRRLRWLPREEWLALSFVSISMHYVLSRTDGSHFFALFPFVALAIVVAGHTFDRRTAIAGTSLLFVILGPAVIFNLVQVSRSAIAQAPILKATAGLLQSEDRAIEETCGALCANYRGDPDELAAAAYIRARTRPDEHVFAGLLHNQSAFVNDMRAYWTLRRPAGTRHIMLMDHLTTSPDLEREIIADLLERDVRWLMLWSKPRDPRSIEGGSLVDAFIRERYAPAQTFNSFEVWRRKDVR